MKSESESRDKKILSENVQGQPAESQSAEQFIKDKELIEGSDDTTLFGLDAPSCSASRSTGDSTLLDGGVNPVKFIYTDAYHEYLESLAEFLESLPDFLFRFFLRFFLKGTKVSSVNSLAVGTDMTLLCDSRNSYVKILSAVVAFNRLFNREVPFHGEKVL